MRSARVPVPHPPLLLCFSICVLCACCCAPRCAFVWALGVGRALCWCCHLLVQIHGSIGPCTCVASSLGTRTPSPQVERFDLLKMALLDNRRDLQYVHVHLLPLSLASFTCAALLVLR